MGLESALGLFGNYFRIAENVFLIAKSASDNVWQRKVEVLFFFFFESTSFESYEKKCFLEKHFQLDPLYFGFQFFIQYVLLTECQLLLHLVSSGTPCIGKALAPTI